MDRSARKPKSAAWEAFRRDALLGHDGRESSFSSGAGVAGALSECRKLAADLVATGVIRLADSLIRVLVPFKLEWFTISHYECGSTKPNGRKDIRRLRLLVAGAIFSHEMTPLA